MDYESDKNEHILSRAGGRSWTKSPVKPLGQRLERRLEWHERYTRARAANFQSHPPTYPRGGVEFGQEEENVLVSRLQRFVLAHAVAVVVPHCEAGGQLSETGRDVGLPLVKTVQLPAGPSLQGHVPKKLNDGRGGGSGWGGGGGAVGLR